MPKRRTPKTRPGRGRAITFDLPIETDTLLESARARLGDMDRVNFVRMVLSERLNADAKAA